MDRDLLRAVLKDTSASTGRAFLRSAVRHLASASGLPVAFVAERREAHSTRACTLALWDREHFADDLDFDVLGNACERVLLHGETVRLVDGAPERFAGLEALGGRRASCFVGAPLLGAKGEVIGLLAALGDAAPRAGSMTEWILELHAARAGAELDRMRTWSRLQRSESQYRALVEQIPVVTYRARLDPEMTAEYVSPQIETLTGFDPTTWCEQPSVWRRQLDPEDRDHVLDRLRQSLEQRRSFVAEYRLRRRDGEVIWVRDEGQFVRDDDGRPIVFQGIMSDVSTEKRMDEELLNNQKLDALGVLAGGVAHEFNNLLTTVLANLTLMRKDTALESSSLRRVDQIEKAALRAAELTREMLAFSGRGHFVVRPVNLTDVVREMAPLFDTLVEGGSRVEIETAEGLPAVEADAGQLRQALINLITNASDALEGRPGTIRVRTDRASIDEPGDPHSLPAGQQHVVVEVSDDGSGMDQATQKRAFDPFFSTKFAGRGLGLAAVLGIVRGHRGVIRLETEPGAGTSARLILPAADAVDRPSRSRATGARRPAPSRASKVLVVDDDDDVQAVTRSMLESEGFDVLTAGGGTEGIDLYRRHSDEISVVLVDLTMPRTGGDEVIEALREVDPRARVILMSGFAETHATRHLDAELAGFLQKPFRTDDLLNELRRVLDG